MTKVFCLQIVLDDTYDSYGTLDELTLLTEAIRRWDIGALDMLPDYMKFIYKSLLDFFAEMEEDMNKEGRAYCVDCPKMMQRVVEAYFAEAIWFNRGYFPSTFDEYMTVALETGSCRLTIAMIFLAMCATKEDFDWFCSDHKIIKAADRIARLLVDKASQRV
ncbi:(E)-beta-farnesene synthase-like [Pistacia vera]|uniref:(E)-beta-farnesene synthase-like n=1 Tax=Pistacia vera TaxID=55513 RepID=UPI0012630818|nr:(E)-beta-farnesene synthase-like [Pistacia vera]